MGSGRWLVRARAPGSVTSLRASCLQDFPEGTSDRAPSSEDLGFLIYKCHENTTHRMTTRLAFVRGWSVCPCVHVRIVSVWRRVAVFSHLTDACGMVFTTPFLTLWISIYKNSVL